MLCSFCTSPNWYRYLRHSYLFLCINFLFWVIVFFIKKLALIYKSLYIINNKLYNKLHNKEFKWRTYPKWQIQLFYLKRERKSQPSC